MAVANTRGSALVETVWAEFAVATLVLCLRTYTTFFLLERATKYAKAATYTAILAWVLGVLSNIFVHLSVANGTGLHLVDIPKSTLPDALLYSSVANFISRLCIATGKVAVIFFLCAIQQNTQTWKQRILLGFIAISNILISIVLIFTIFFQCDPPRKLWHPQIPGNCNLRYVNNNYSFLVTAWGAASDLFLAIYPTYLFWSLQLERKTKVGMSILCGLGIIAAAFATITCYQVHVLSHSSDPTYYKTSLTIWSFSEMWVIIIAASVPASWPWFVTMISKLKASLGHRLPESWQSKHSKATSSERNRLSARSDTLGLGASNPEEWEARLHKNSVSKGSNLTAEEIALYHPRSHS